MTFIISYEYYSVYRTRFCRCTYTKVVYSLHCCRRGEKRVRATRREAAKKKGRFTLENRFRALLVHTPAEFTTISPWNFFALAAIFRVCPAFAATNRV